jgi:hypothetical protein
VRSRISQGLRITIGCSGDPGKVSGFFFRVAGLVGHTDGRITDSVYPISATKAPDLHDGPQ